MKTDSVSKKISCFAIILLCAGLCTQAQSFSGVEQLAQRRVPWLLPHLQFSAMEKDKGADVFRLSMKAGKVNIAATGANAAAVGLNWYLKYYCHRSMSHMGDNLSAVSSLPQIPQPVTITASAEIRYALNYCTYNYTMSFYTWSDWEHELDWMALNGVNAMLVANGEEAVWQNTLRRLGYTENEINDYITGPAFNAWWLMGNIQGWGGPMPQSQVDGRKQLVQKMLARMNTLGIAPVMPCFFGMVPSTLRTKINAHFIPQGNWGAFVRPDILDPTDTAFVRIAGIFYEETKKLYGKDIHFFSGDPFHEGGITDGVDLAKAGAAILNNMQRYFPGATWVLQGWQANPRREMLSELDKSHILVQELFGETTNNWEKRSGYESTPFIWCMITNYGERPGLFGKLQRYADEPYRARKGPWGPYLKGIGIMPEGINNNPVAFDWMLEMGWHSERADAAAWIKEYTLYRYGRYDKDIIQAWQLFLQTIYSSPEGYQEGPPENILCARPALQIKSVSSWGTLRKNYSIDTFLHAVKLFAAAAPRCTRSDTYKIDLINFTRQAMANTADSVFARLVEAYTKKDVAAFDRQANRFLQLINATNQLLNTHSWYCLDTYQRQAMLAGNTPEEKQNNLRNLMMLITYWGEHNRKEDYLHEYAYKEWAGMMRSFYGPRWQMYFDFLRKQLKGEPVAAPDFFAWERNWATEHEKVDTRLRAVPLMQIVNRILGDTITDTGLVGEAYHELPDPRPADPALWQGIPSELKAAFGDAGIRYQKSSPPPAGDVSMRWTATAWKGERVHTQLLVWSTAGIDRLHVRHTALTNSKGNKIPAAAITTGMVRYVLTDGLGGSGSGCGIPPSNTTDSSLVEDAIDPVTSTILEKNSTRPVWLSVDVPLTAPAGNYTGSVQLYDDKKQLPVVLHYSIEVKAHVLPKPADRAFHLDLWQNPYSIARVHGVKEWSDAHFNAMRPYMQLLADAGQKAITVSMIYDPWRGQTYDIYGSMIQWIKKKDGTWQYDYSIFDKWVAFMLSLGIDKVINCYSMEPWNATFYYYDEAYAKDTFIVAKPGSAAYAAHWKPMLNSFIHHLKEKGWFNKTSIAMDERPLADMQQIITLVRSIDKDIHISLAGSFHAEIEKDIYDYSIGSADSFGPAVIAKRVEKGMPTTYYTCCVEGHPNTFTFSPPAESAWLGWFAAAKGYSGYLRWAYNCWPATPLQDSRFRSWSAGDTYLVYPGPMRSIRFERMVEGIQDYEKIRLLKVMYAKQPEKLRALQTVLDGFDIGALKDNTAAGMLQKGKAILDAL